MRTGPAPKLDGKSTPKPVSQNFEEGKGDMVEIERLDLEGVTDEVQSSLVTTSTQTRKFNSGDCDTF